MSESMTRFTAYLSERERALMRERARELGTSENVIVRLALRLFLELPIPPWAQLILRAENARRLDRNRGEAA